MDASQPHAVTYRVLFHVGQGATHVRVVKVVDQVQERMVLRLKATTLPLTRDQLGDARDEAVVLVLMGLLLDRLEWRPAGRSGAPSGATGGAGGGWSQPTFNLALRE